MYRFGVITAYGSNFGHYAFLSPALGELGDNVECLSWAHSKARSGLLIIFLKPRFFLALTCTSHLWFLLVHPTLGIIDCKRHKFVVDVTFRLSQNSGFLMLILLQKVQFMLTLTKMGKCSYSTCEIYSSSDSETVVDQQVKQPPAEKQFQRVSGVHQERKKAPSTC